MGLITSSEIDDIKLKLNTLSSIAEETIDIDSIIELANSVDYLTYDKPNIKVFDKKVKIAVAHDNAFCFYYRDNLELLEQMGAELVYFSPISDTSLPNDIDGLYLGGGYPEIYADKLSSNKSMLSSIKHALEHNLPCIAECGGFMYISKEINGHSMVGYLDGKAIDTGKLTRFGYVQITANEDNMLCQKGESIKAHEFHYYDSTNNGTSFTAKKESGKTWNCVVANKYLYAGYPHIHFYSNLSFAENFYKACINYSQSV